MRFVWFQCPTGTHSIMCDDGHPETTRCVTCGPGTYQPYGRTSEHALYCQDKGKCKTEDGEECKNFIYLKGMEHVPNIFMSFNKYLFLGVINILI